MSDGVKELIIRIKREIDPAGEAASKAFFANEKKRIKENLSDVEIAEKAKTAFARREIQQRIQAQARAQQTTTEQAKAAQGETNKAVADGMKAAAQIARQADRERRQLERESVASLKAASAQRTKLMRDEAKSVDASFAFTRKAIGGATVAIGGLTAAATSMMRGMAASSQEATGYIRGMVEKAEAARDALREIAALTGKENTLAGAAGQARAAAKAGVSPEKYAQAQERWEQFAGSLIGNGPEHKLTREQSDEIFNQATTYSQARGSDSGDTAQLLATIVQASPKGTPTKEIMSQFAKAQKVAELASGPTGPIVRQIAEIANQEIGGGGSIKNVTDAAPFVQVAAQADAGSAGMLTEAMLRGLREVRKDPEKMQKLGITKDMNIMQQLGAVNTAADAHVAGGGDEGMFLDEFFKDSREWRGIRSMLNAGIRGGAFARADAQMAGVDDQTVTAVGDEYKNSQMGRFQTRKSDLTASERDRAEKFARMREIELEEKKNLTDSGDLERPEGPVGWAVRAAKGAFGAGDRESQLMTARMGNRLKDQLLATPEGTAYAHEHHLIPDSPNQVTTGTGQLGGAFTPTKALADGFNFVEQLNAKMDAQLKAIQEQTKVIREANPAGPPKVLQRQAAGAPPNNVGRPGN